MSSGMHTLISLLCLLPVPVSTVSSRAIATYTFLITLMRSVYTSWNLDSASFCQFRYCLVGMIGLMEQWRTKGWLFCIHYRITTRRNSSTVFGYSEMITQIFSPWQFLWPKAWMDIYPRRRWDRGWQEDGAVLDDFFDCWIMCWHISEISKFIGTDGIIQTGLDEINAGDEYIQAGLTLVHQVGTMHDLIVSEDTKLFLDLQWKVASFE